MRRETTLCHAEKLAGKERHKDNHVLSKVLRWGDEENQRQVF